MRIPSNNGVNHLSSPAPATEKPNIRVAPKPVVSNALFSHLVRGHPLPPIQTRVMRGETEPAQFTHLLGLSHALQMTKTPAAGTKASISSTPTPVVSQSALKKPLGAAAGEPQPGGFAEQIIEPALPQLGALPRMGESAERG